MGELHARNDCTLVGRGVRRGVVAALLLCFEGCRLRCRPRDARDARDARLRAMRVVCVCCVALHNFFFGVEVGREGTRNTSGWPTHTHTHPQRFSAVPSPSLFFSLVSPPPARAPGLQVARRHEDVFEGVVQARGRRRAAVEELVQLGVARRALALPRPVRAPGVVDGAAHRAEAVGLGERAREATHRVAHRPDHRGVEGGVVRDDEPAGRSADAVDPREERGEPGARRDAARRQRRAADAVHGEGAGRDAPRRRRQPPVLTVPVHLAEARVEHDERQLDAVLRRPAVGLDVEDQVVRRRGARRDRRRHAPAGRDARREARRHRRPRDARFGLFGVLPVDTIWRCAMSRTAA